MDETMGKYYKKVNLMNLALGAYFLLSALFMQISDTQLFISLACIFFMRFLTGKSKDELRKIKLMRREVLKRNNSLIYIGVFQNLILPLIFGICAFYLFSFTYNQALFVFVGFACLFAILTNLRFSPHMIAAETSETFD